MEYCARLQRNENRSIVQVKGSGAMSSLVVLVGLSEWVYHLASAQRAKRHVKRVKGTSGEHRRPRRMSSVANSRRCTCEQY